MSDYLNKLKRGNEINVFSTKSLIFGHDVYGKYLFDSWNDNKETAFIQPLNEPTGKRFLIKTEFIEIQDENQL